MVISGGTHHWLHGAVLYQIYPRSFYDSDGDGTGDLKGITRKLDYLKGEDDSLDIDVIWISPFYPSPMADFGYDVSSYIDVDPLFGNLDDFRELLHAAHRRGIKVLIDFIPNHTSDEHEWFRESKSSLTNSKRDWYVWKDPQADGSAPNNWTSVFGGSAWELDRLTGQYYLHSFLKKQPDLNWDNPEVREAMKQQMKFWLDMGVDGFRVDAVTWISKDAEYRDQPANPSFNPDTDDPHHAQQQIYSQAGPNLYAYLDEMAAVIGQYQNRIMITESYPQEWNDLDAYEKFYEHVDPTQSAPFNFTGIFSPWHADSFRTVIDDFQSRMKPAYLPIYCLGNHDRSRLATRIGQRSSKTAAVLLLTLPGMPTLYYGDELGMTDVPIKPDQVQDPLEKNVPGKGLGRDPARSPMQWNTIDYAGFSSKAPWLPVSKDFELRNVASQQKQPGSHLNLYKKLIALRHSYASLQVGAYDSLHTPVDVYGFKRFTSYEQIAVLLNFSDKVISFEVNFTGTLLASTEHAAERMDGTVTLAPHEGLVLLLDQN